MTDDERNADPYDKIAEFYDLEHATYDEDLSLYLNLAIATGDPIIELGCGSGRLLLPLASHGFRVTGVDRSAAMIARAERAAKQAGLIDRVTLHTGSMNNLNLVQSGSYGLAIIGLNGFCHATSTVEQRRTLEAVRTALDPRGQLIIDVFNPSLAMLHSVHQSVVHEGSWLLTSGERVDKFSSRRVSTATQMIETDLWYDTTNAAGAVRRVATSFPMRYVTAAELALMLEMAGFAEWQFYGGYDLEPYRDDAERLIVTAELTPGRP